ncbi:Uncharacterised protein [Mycobacteroides abscessus subsp. abscessus]|nr:Uncharacterised protein [Mycobacteroides abscessus subsp. abscessus]
MGELPDCWNAATTFRRLRARSFFWPLPFLMVSRSDSASASMSKVSMSFLIDSAPMAPVKYSP